MTQFLSGTYLPSTLFQMFTRVACSLHGVLSVLIASVKHATFLSRTTHALSEYFERPGTRSRTLTGKSYTERFLWRVHSLGTLAAKTRRPVGTLLVVLMLTGFIKVIKGNLL